MPADTPPNIVVVLADQLRGADLGVAGNPDVQTPNLDRFASQGVRLTHAYANTPVCTPSRATMLTGLYPTHHRVVGNDLPLPVGTPSIGSIVSEAGYRTGYIGKWHLDGVPREKFTPPGPRRHGFEFWAAYNCSHAYFDAAYYRDDPEPVAIEGYEPTVQTDLACEFLLADDQRPFCLFLSWGPPHDPYDQVPDEFRTGYDSDALQLRDNVAEPVADATPLANGLDPRTTIANYYAAVTALDHEMGRLLDALQQSGRAEDTIVIFTSDHGDMLWSHGRMKKQQPWEESINIPLLVRWPGRIARGTVVDGLFSMVDLTPTLLGLAGVGHGHPMDGVDRGELLLGRADAGASSVYLMDLVMADESLAQRLPEWRGVRTDRYTYATKADGNPWLLYDNVSDPWQLTNLVDDPTCAPIQRELDTLISDWRAHTKDDYRDGQDCIDALGLTELWSARQRYAERFKIVREL